MEGTIYLIFTIACGSIAYTLLMLLNANKKLAAKSAEADALRKEVESTQLKMDRVGEIFSAIEERADDEIRQLRARNEELEKIMRLGSNANA